jgi:hypothetical protein
MVERRRARLDVYEGLMPPVYNLASTAVPALQVRTTLIDTSVTDPTLVNRRKLAAGTTGPGSLTGPFNQNANKCDAQGAFAGGAYAVWTGLDLAAGTWPAFTVSAGQAGIDGPVTVPTALSLSATNGTRNWVWLRAGGTVIVVTGSTAPPAGACLLLGSFNPSGSVFDSPDYSGRPSQVQGCLVLVRSSDAAKPTWTAPAGLRYLHRTAGGLYLWEGANYWLLGTAPA